MLEINTDLCDHKKICENTVEEYEGSFVRESLKLLEKDESDFCDFKIICKNAEEYKCHKFVLVSRSEYFRAMFRFEPKKETLELYDFDGPMTDIILKSFISIDAKIFESNLDDLFQLVQISDYFQMKELSEIMVPIILHKIKEDNFDPNNVYRLEGISHYPEVISLLNDLFKKHIQEIDLKKLPRKTVQKLAGMETRNVVDQYGRVLDLIHSDVIIFKALKSLDKNERWELNASVKRRLISAIDINKGTCQAIHKILENMEMSELEKADRLVNLFFGIHQISPLTHASHQLLIEDFQFYDVHYFLRHTDQGFSTYSNIGEDIKYVIEENTSNDDKFARILVIMGLNFGLNASIMEDSWENYSIQETCKLYNDYRTMWGSRSLISRSKGIQQSIFRLSHSILKMYSPTEVKNLVFKKGFLEMDDNFDDKSNHPWSIFGNFRKITFQVTNIRLSMAMHLTRVVQGLRVVFDDGSVKSIGMEATSNNHENNKGQNNIFEFEVPGDQHIKDVYVLKVGGKSASFGFMTNENVKMFPFTYMPGPSSKRNVELLHVPVVEDFAKYIFSKFNVVNTAREKWLERSEDVRVKELTNPNYYLCGIQGRIGQRSPSEPPCLIDLNFCYALTFNSIDTSIMSKIFCNPTIDNNQRRIYVSDNNYIRTCDSCGKIFANKNGYAHHEQEGCASDTDSEDSD